MSSLRFVVVGAGAVGSLLAAYLARAGNAVAVVARPAHVAAIQDGGLRVVERDGSTWRARPAAVEHVADAGLRRDDVVLLTVKSYDTERAVADLAAAVDTAGLAGPAAIACVQNGVANEAVVAERFERVYGVVARFSARLLEPGVVLAAGNRELEFGRYPARIDEMARRLAERAREAGIVAQTRPDIMAAKWTKLVMNCANAIYAICDVPVQAARSDPDVARLVNLVWAEAETALAAAGVVHEPVAPLPPPPPASPHAAPAGGAEAAGGAGGQPAHPGPVSPAGSGAGTVHAGAYYGSTWDDLDRRSGKSELPWLNGEIVRLAERNGVPAPVNAWLLRAGAEMAARREPPGRCTPAELLAAVAAG
jgi:2-dehydropantoate 2-reductase